jgi:signal peptidase I
MIEPCNQTIGWTQCIGLSLCVWILMGCVAGDRVRLRTGALYPTLNRTSQCRVRTPPGPLERGHVVVITIDGVKTTRRITAVAGDRVAMDEGRITLNGTPLGQRVIKKRVMCRVGVSPKCACRIAEETLGERTYRVQHLLPPGVDDDARCERQYPDADEQIVSTGHVFVTADNRDGALDSRTVGPVPVNQIQGRVMSCRY